MKRVNVFLSVALGFLLTACSSMIESSKRLESSVIELMTPDAELIGEPKQLTEFAASEITITERWQKEVNEGQGNVFLKLEMAVEGGFLYSVDYQGVIVALDQQTGEKVWEVATKLPVSGGLGIGLDNLFVGTTDGEVIALALADGATVWTAQVSSEVLSIPRYSDGSVVIRSVDGAITALTADTGEELWTYVRDVPALSLRGTSSPVIKSGGVMAGYANGQLVVIRLNDGMQIWQTSVAVARGRGALSRMVDVDSDPLAGERLIYATTYNGGLAAVDVRSGNIVWRQPELSSYKAMSADWTSVFLVDGDNVLWSADQTDGSINWSQNELEHRGLTAPVVMDDYIIVGDFEGYVHVLSNIDGRLLGRIKIGKHAIKMAPVIDGEYIYVQDEKGTITALQFSANSESED